MKFIKLSKGYYTIVDDEDFEWLNQQKWHINIGGSKRSVNHIYACSYISQKGKKKLIYMHKYILGISKNKLGDHIDGNTLNNSRKNLRICSFSGNSRNTFKTKNETSSKYKGVHFNINTKSWEAQISFRKKKKFLGLYKNEDDAAIAYNKRAIELFGEFAKLNYI